MVPPRIHICLLIYNTLLDYNLLRLLMICNAQVRRIVSNVVERCRGVGFDLSHNKGLVIMNVLSRIVDKGVCQSLDETRLASLTNSNPQLNGRFGIIDGPVVDCRQRYFAGCLLAGSVNENTRSHSW